MACIDDLKKAYKIGKKKLDEKESIQKYKAKEKAIKIVENLYPTLLKVAKSGECCHRIYGGWFFNYSKEVMLEIADLINKEGLSAEYIYSYVLVWGWDR